MIDNLREALTEMGYVLFEFPKEFRARPLYRESNNNTSLRVNKSTGNWRDYGLGIGGTFKDLVKMTLNLKTVDEAEAYVQKNFNISLTTKTKPRPELRMPVTFPNEMLTRLMPEHDYWLKRGISIETIRLFEGGVAKTGKMANRYVFPVFNSKRVIVGFSGRDLTGKSPMKWKHIGSKTEWNYPLFVNYPLIDTAREVILVESIGDALSLFDAGVKNVMVTFGVELSTAVTNTLLRVDPKRIIIALNNEPDNNSIGNNAALKMQTKLAKHFDLPQIKIALPPKKDFNEMIQDDRNSVNEWYAKIS